MLKRISCLTLCMLLSLGVLVQQVTALEDPTVAEELIAVPEVPGIFVDDAVVEAAAPVLYEQTTYVSLRGVAAAIRPDAVVAWKGSYAAVTADGLSITVYPGAKYILANDRYLYLPYGVLIENGCIMVPVRELAKALGAQTWWNASDGNVYITTGTGAIVSGNEYYNGDDLYWLSHIIYAESGNQPLEGKIGVGNVILNRVNSSLFPNTIYEVIFQRNQFTPASSGSIYKQPNAESIIAAKLCLEGVTVLPNALWFNRASCSSWASKNRPYIATIGAHAFYS